VVTAQETLAVADNFYRVAQQQRAPRMLAGKPLFKSRCWPSGSPKSSGRSFLKWGSHEDEDVRAAIGTCLLEDLL
jgi:hypothetical protein